MWRMSSHKDTFLLLVHFIMFLTMGTVHKCLFPRLQMRIYNILANIIVLFILAFVLYII